MKSFRNLGLAFSFFFLSGVFSSSFAFAASGDFELIGTQGNVSVTRAGSPVGVAKDLPLMEGDVVKTEAGAFAVIGMEGYGRFDLTADSELHIVKKQLQSKIIDSELKLFVGKVRGDLKKLPKGSSFKLVTPTSVAAVRGTAFLITASISGMTMAYVENGSINMESSATGEVTPVDAGEAIAASSSGVETIDPNSPEFAAIVEAFTAIAAQSESVAAEAPESGDESVEESQSNDHSDVADDVSDNANSTASSEPTASGSH